MLCYIKPESQDISGARSNLRISNYRQPRYGHLVEMMSFERGAVEADQQHTLAPWRAFSGHGPCDRVAGYEGKRRGII
jgi:hypothetical protein